MSRGTEQSKQVEGILGRTLRQPGAGGRLKSGIKKIGYRTGLVPAIARWGRARAFVITYHRVERRPSAPLGAPALDVSAFTRHLEYLTRHHEVMPLSTMVQQLRKGAAPRNAVALTFDDGYRNNLVLAYPALRRFRVPATIFVTAGLVGTRRWMWPSELCEMCLRYGTQAVGEACGDRLLSALMGVELPPTMKVEASVEYLLGLGPAPREAVLRRLRARYPVEPDDENEFLSWDEVRALRAGGLEIGSHTMTHPVLTDLAANEVEAELSASRRTIEEEVGTRPALFAYPHGSFSPAVKNLVRRYYGAAVSTIAGDNTASTDPLELRRIAAYGVEDLSYEMARPR